MPDRSFWSSWQVTDGTSNFRLERTGFAGRSPGALYGWGVEAEPSRLDRVWLWWPSFGARHERPRPRTCHDPGRRGDRFGQPLPGGDRSRILDAAWPRRMVHVTARRGTDRLSKSAMRAVRGDQLYGTAKGRPVRQKV